MAGNDDPTLSEALEILETEYQWIVVDIVRPATVRRFDIGADEWAGLSKLIEECGEAVQVAGKLIATRGDVNHWEGRPLDERLADELGDVMAAVDFMLWANPRLNAHGIGARRLLKLRQFQDWHEEQSALATEGDG